MLIPLVIIAEMCLKEFYGAQTLKSFESLLTGPHDSRKHFVIIIEPTKPNTFA